MTEADRAAVVEMMVTFYDSDATFTKGTVDIFNEDISACISDSPFIEGFVCEDEEGQLKGYSMVAHSYCTEFGKPCLWLEDLYFGEELRGRGYATEFLDFLHEEYPDHVLRLESEHENEHAMDIYKHKGFTVIPYVELIRNTD